jgi:LmbE family N-acetylglucosaminyl deacetylase
MTLLPLQLRSQGPFRVLGFGAHCDDIEIGCGGTLARLARDHQDLEVSWVVMTSTPEREAETRAAAMSLLADEASVSVTVHPFRDGFLPAVVAEVKEVFEALKAEPHPDLIFTPWSRDAHQDHRLVSELTWNTFRDHTIFEYEIPKYDGDLGRPNLFVPLDEDVCSRKIGTLLSCFPSQLGRSWFEEETFRSIMRLRGVECNAPERYAEAFHVRKILLGSSIEG